MGPSVHKVGEIDQLLLIGSGPTQPGVPSVAHFTPVSRVLAAPLLATRGATKSGQTVCWWVGRRIFLEWRRRGQNNVVLYQKGAFAGGKAPI